MNKDILFQMVANKRGGIDPSLAIQSAIIETVNLPAEADCRIELDPSTNQYKVFRYWTVVEDEEDPEMQSLNHASQITLSAAKEKNPNAQLGDAISEEVHFSRIEFQKFKRLFSMSMRKAERSQVADAYRSRIGQLFIGKAQRPQFAREGITLELEEDVEMLLPPDQMIPREEIRTNDRLYVYLYDINPDAKGPQLLVSRTAPGLLKRLMELKILEVNSGVIEVKSVARDPGSRAKIAVKTNDGRLNPIGTCIGRSGERIQAISQELNDEHIDIVLWDDNPAQLAINALAPAEVVSITMNEDTRVMDIAVRNEDLARAIGRSGQNVRLASQLTGWILNIMSIEEADQKNVRASKQLELNLQEQLGLESDQAKQLVQQGFSTIEEVAYTPAEDLAALLHLDENQIALILEQANNALLAKAFASESELMNSSEEQAPLSNLKGMTPELLRVLNHHKIDSQEALAELSIDDLLEIAPLTRQEAGQLIMNARADWFKNPDTT